MQVDGATSISTILLVDVDVGSFSSYIYQPTHWAKHTKTTVRRAPSLRNPSCSKLDFSPPSLAIAVAVPAALPDSTVDPEFIMHAPRSRPAPRGPEYCRTWKFSGPKHLEPLCSSPSPVRPSACSSLLISFTSLKHRQP